MTIDGTPLDLDGLLDLARATAEEAAAMLLDGMNQERAEVHTKSSATDMVTEMDRRSEQLIVDRLLAARPDDGLLGEEGARRDGTSGVVWVIDPLDGTTNYLYGLAGFNVSIAAVHEDRSMIGVVVDPIRGETFTATAGAGSCCNGVRLPGPASTEPGQTLLGTGFAYDPERRAAQGAVMATVLPQVRDVRRMGAAALDLCLVACGRIDAFYERGLAPWDLAAGGLVASESGATVGNLSGGRGGPDGVLAAHPDRFTALAALLREAGADHA